MEFSKSRTQRSALARPTTTPGPGAYDIPEDAPRTGAMLDKSDRFHENLDQTDTFGLYGLADKENLAGKRRAAAPGNADRVRLQTEELKLRLTATHEKDLAKLQAKLAKADAAREEAVRERNEGRAELLGYKSEIRTAAARESALKASLDKSDAALLKQTTAFPLLKSQMAELTASHGSSLQKRDAELVGLRAEIKAVRRELEGRNMELGEQEAAIRSSTATSRDVCDNLEGVTELLEWTRDALRQTVRAFGEWREERADLGNDEWEALQAQALEREYRIVALEGRLATSQRTVSSLQADNLILRSSNELLRTQFDDLTHDLARMQGEIRWSNAVRHTEKDWRQRARADGRESHVLRHEVASLTSHLTSSLDYSHHLHLSSVATHAELQRDQELLQRELEIAEGELEEAMEVEIPALEDEVISLSNTLSIATLDESNLRSLLLEAEETLAELQITSKEETEGLSGELEECARMLSERESEVQKLKVDRIKASGNLGLHKAAEKALLQELASTQAQLAALHSTAEENVHLRQLYETSSRRLALAENEMLVLGERNDEIIGHGNGRQKIRAVEGLRKGLVESRQKHLATTTALSFQLAETAALKVELSAYRAVQPASHYLSSSSYRPHASNNARDTQPFTASIGQRTRVQRQSLSSPPPLPPVPALVPSSSYTSASEEEDYDLISPHEELLDLQNAELENPQVDGMASSVVRRSGRATSQGRRDGWSSGSSGGRSTRGVQGEEGREDRMKGLKAFEVGMTTPGGARKMLGKMSVSELL